MAVRPDVLDHLLGIVAGFLGLLTDQCVDVVVGDLDPRPVGHRLERQFTSDRSGRLSMHLSDEDVGRLAGDLEIGIGRDAPATQGADEAVEQFTGSRLDERPGPLNVRSGHERVDGGRAECLVDLLLDRDANPPLDVSAKIGQGVELARGARQLVVDLRQHLLVHVLDGDRDGGGGVVRELVRHFLRLPHARTDESGLDLLHETTRPELDDGVRLRLSGGALQVDDERIARPGRPVVRGHELRDGLP